MIERNEVDLKEEMCELGLDEQLQSSLVLDRWKEEIEKMWKTYVFLISSRARFIENHSQDYIHCTF